MTRHITDDDRRLFITTYYNLIESALEVGRSHMGNEPGCRPELVDFVFGHIGDLAKFGQRITWPDPAKRVQDARQDPALQQLLKRASKPTPIRAGRALKGAK